MLKQLTPKQWKTCFKKYENYDSIQFWNYYVKFKKTKIITKGQKRWFLNVYISYKKGNINIIYSMSGKKATGRPKKKIDWDIFTWEDLIKIAERYKEITEEKKKKDKMKEAKNLDLWIFKLVALLGISKQDITKTKKSLINLEETKTRINNNKGFPH